eukprot:TRINITY_DN4519_c0_g1_i1.p1 TRINITY_DN4519_c0_g1~~TRINITY_DN4519_c0_g1_i1.p1  ORF type:complete len:494 (-),score=118.37 TRINITY_DN4519_c0_g1_i1:165-1646(-)
MWEVDLVSKLSTGLVIAGICTILATLLSLRLIYKHMRHYNYAKIQRPIVRIVLMVPIYALASFCSLVFMSWSLYFDLVRDCYEAYVIYNFFTLLVEYINVEVRSRRVLEMVPPVEDALADGMAVLGGAVGGGEQEGRHPQGHSSTSGRTERDLERLLKEKPLQAHPFPLCCLPRFQPGRTFLLWSKRCILQFMIVKPAMTITAIILEHYGVYGDGDLSFQNGYIYVATADNISITIAMYWLILFFYVTEQELAPARPIPKFVCIKAVIFLTFWQGVTISILSYFHVIHGNLAQGFTDQQVSNGLQEFLICIEMFLVALAHGWTFSYEPFRRLSDASGIPCYSCLCCLCCCCKVTKNLTHVVSQDDLIEESKEAFQLDDVPGTLSDIGSSGLRHGSDLFSSISSLRSKSLSGGEGGGGNNAAGDGEGDGEASDTSPVDGDALYRVHERGEVLGGMCGDVLYEDADTGEGADGMLGGGGQRQHPTGDLGNPFAFT